MSVLDVVRLPIKPGEKATRYPKWSDPSVRPTAEEFAADDNVAWRLDGLVDVDLDSSEARKYHERFLPPTRTHGRPSLGVTHLWFAATEPVKPEQFRDTDGSVLVEIRAGHLQYTVVPPSVVLTKGDDPQPETLEWLSEIDLSPIGAGVRHLVRLLATACLLSRHWPNGARHHIALAVAGFLAAHGIDQREVEEIISVVCDSTRDDESGDRLTAVRTTFATYKSGGKTSGGPTLERHLGRDVVRLLRDGTARRRAARSPTPKPVTPSALNRSTQDNCSSTIAVISGSN